MVELEADQDDAEDHRGDDQEVADLCRGLLRVRGALAGRGDQAGGAAEEGLVAGGDHDGAHLALLGDAAGVALVADLLGDGQGFAGQRCLVDADVVTVDEPHVGRHDLAELDPEHVARHYLGGVDRGEAAVAQCRGLGCEAGLQGGQGIRRLALLPEPRDCIVEEQDQNDREVSPMAHQQRQDRRRLDHPRDRPPEEAQELLEIADLVVGKLVAAVVLQSRAGLGRAQALR